MTTRAGGDAAATPDAPPANRGGFVAWAAGRRNGLRATAFLMCGDWHQADDLVQETLTRVYSRWDRLARTGPPDAYARRVLVRLELDRQRRSWWRRVTVRDPEPDALITHDTPVVDGDRPLMLEVLATLPSSQRAVIVLRYWEDLSVAQIAAALSVREGTVRAHASRGLAALRVELSRRGIEGLPDLDADAEGGLR